MCLLLPYILPPQMTTEFIEQRRAALTIFINRVVRSMGGMQHCCQLAAVQACVSAHCPSGQHASSATAAHPLPGPSRRPPTLRSRPAPTCSCFWRPARPSLVGAHAALDLALRKGQQSQYEMRHHGPICTWEKCAQLSCCRHRGVAQPGRRAARQHAAGGDGALAAGVGCWRLWGRLGLRSRSCAAEEPRLAHATCHLLATIGHTTMIPVSPSPPHPQGAAKKTLASAVGFLRDLSHTASNLYHKRSDDEEEDAEYLKVGWLGGVGRQGGMLQHPSEMRSGASGRSSCRPWKTEACRAPHTPPAVSPPAARCVHTCTSWSGTWGRRTGRRRASCGTRWDAGGVGRWAG